MDKKSVCISAAIAAAVAFPAGFAAGNGTVNVGLVEALSSVGSNIFGEGNFAASIADVDGSSGVQFDLAESVGGEIPGVFNIFHPPDPVQPYDSCAAAVQIAVTDDALKIFYNQSLTPMTIETNEVPALGHPPDPCRGDVVVVPEF
jgi:hypothetical protein